MLVEDANALALQYDFVPADRHSRILVDDRVVRATVADGYARLTLPGGTYRVTVLRH